MDRERLTRRDFVKTAVYGAGGLTLAACAGSQPPQTLVPTNREYSSPPTGAPTGVLEEPLPEPGVPEGKVEREFADSILILGDARSFPNISETMLEIGYKPVWVEEIPEKETLFKYPVIFLLGIRGNVPFEGLQTYITRQDGGLIVFGGPHNNPQFNFAGIEYKESGDYGDYVVKFNPNDLTTSREFIATDIRVHPITVDMKSLTIRYHDGTVSLSLHPSCKADPSCQGVIYGGENTYTKSGDIQNPPIVVAREYPSGGRIVVGPTYFNFGYRDFGGEDNVQLIRNSLLWVLHMLP